MQYMSICIHEEFRSERCGKMKVILSANTYWELVTRCVHLVCLPIGRSRDSFLFLSRSTCFLSAYSVASPGLRDGNKGWVGHIFALLDFRRDPLGLMKGPFQSHCLFPEAGISCCLSDNHLTCMVSITHHQTPITHHQSGAAVLESGLILIVVGKALVL